MNEQARELAEKHFPINYATYRGGKQVDTNTPRRNKLRKDLIVFVAEATKQLQAENVNLVRELVATKGKLGNVFCEESFAVSCAKAEKELYEHLGIEFTAQPDKPMKPVFVRNKRAEAAEAQVRELTEAATKLVNAVMAVETAPMDYRRTRLKCDMVEALANLEPLIPNAALARKETPSKAANPDWQQP